MSAFFNTLKTVVTDSKLRSRVLFVLGALFVFRLLAAIPVPTIETFELQSFFDSNQFFGLINVFSGGGLANLSIVMLGVGPYITASIIMQLLTMMSPRIKSLYHEEGEAGRRKFIQYSRLLTVPLAVLQGYGFLKLLQSQGVILGFEGFDMILSVIVVAAGSMLLMWIGELITEFGIGNGSSIIIFAGIVAALPGTALQLAYTFDPSQIPTYIAFIAVAFVVILLVVLVSDSERPVPVTYAKQVNSAGMSGGSTTYLPLRVNQAGVIPIIFALSVLLFPQMLLGLMTASGNGILLSIADFLKVFYASAIYYPIAYFLMVFAFTYFYTAITFEPDSVAENLQKSGAFVPGVRPGMPTSEFLAKVVTRITLIGATFLGFIAVLPLIMQQVTGVQALTIGGTGLLIVVSVVMDLIKKVNAQVSMREY